MALQVWLPLNGNIKNQGLSNITVTNNGATVDNSGKIGKCYYFDGNDYIQIGIPSELKSIKNSSVCAWVKSMNSTLALGGISHNGTSSIAGVTLYSSGWQISGNPNGWQYINGGTIANTQIWHHVCCTIDDNIVTTYLDGSKVATNTLSGMGITVTDITSSNFIEIGCDHPGGDEYLTGYVNDFRVYDHALSPKEVELISRGLVVHYPLNGNGGGQPNLYNFESVASIWKVSQKTGVTLVDATDDVYGNVLKFTIPSSVDSARIYRGVKNVWKADTNFTVSFLAKASKTAVLKIERSRTDYAPDVTVGTTWKRYSTVIPCTGTTTGGALGITSDTTGADIYLTQIKVELGDKATAYCPGVGDSHYVPLGYDSTTEYDVSGNNNHSTITGTLEYSSNSAKYSSCVGYNNSSYNSVTLNTSGFANTYTFSWWARNTSQGMFWGFANGNRLNLYMVNDVYYWNTGDGGGNPFNVSSTPYRDGNWHHYAITGDGTTVKLYIDATQQGTAKTFKGITGTILIFNGWDTSSSYDFNGYLSDFRLYATALTADQVKELYQTSASIDKNGNMYAYEYVEV